MTRILIILISFFFFQNLQGQAIIDNHIFSLSGDFRDWTVMSDSELGDRIVFARETSGRRVNYIAGLIHKNGMPTVLFQSREFDMSKMTPKINFEAFEEKSTIPARVEYNNANLPMPVNVLESVMTVPGRYSLTKYELFQDNEPAFNFNYLFLHGKGHLQMHSLTYVGEAINDFQLFEKIRKGLTFKKELPFELGGDTTKPISTTTTTEVTPNKTDKKKSAPKGSNLLAIIIPLCLLPVSYTHLTLPTKA